MKRMQRVFGDLDALRFVDGRLDEERRAAFLSHLADDAAASERVAIWGRQNEVIRAAFAGVAMEPIPAALRVASLAAARPVASPATERPPTPLRVLPAAAPGALAEERRTEPAGTAPLRRLPPRETRRSTALVGRGPLGAVLLFAVAILVLLIARAILPPTTGPVARDSSAAALLVSRATDAYDTYATDPVRPVEFTATRLDQMDAWLRRRLGVGLVPPDFALEGWALLGGRVVPGPDGPAAFYVYQNSGGERLGLLASRAPSYGLRVMPLGAAGTQGSAMTWGTGQLGFVIAVPRSLDWLSRNGEALRDSVIRHAG